MKKFNNLLKKEIKELVTAQLIISLVAVIILFSFMGNLTKSEIKKSIEKKDLYVLDLDKSALSMEVLNNLSFGNFRIKLINKLIKEENRENAIKYAKENNINFLMIIPRDFERTVSQFKSKEIEIYSFIKSFSLGSTIGSNLINQVIVSVNRYISNNFLKSKFPEIDPDDLKNPIKSKEFIIVKDKMAEGSTSQVINMVYSQSIFIPIILMMVIMFSSQMVLSAIAMEKQDKTLETLLTVPISRKQIVIAKMMGAGIVGVISAGIYMLGYRSFMTGVMGDVKTSDITSQVIQKLGLQLTPSGYFLLGVSLFLAILCALALATILGVLAEDLKSAQGMALPLIFLIMIPYFLSLFSDINSLSLPLKIFILAIPFTHPFLASQNILLGNYSIVAYGIIYMFAVFVVLIFISAKIFSTDRVLTMKLRFGGKKLLKGS
ncbi:MAG: ABC transporter permease [Dictyoglomus sp.]|nr:ABC transporter permease [Dictyoglomus sp.]MDW8188632.1 ABC transporter permease [Dictyoglomus sp.]